MSTALWAFILVPPWPSVVAVGMAAFLAMAGGRVAVALGREDRLSAFAGFALVSGVLAIAIHLLAWAGAANGASLRWVAWGQSLGGWALAVRWLWANVPGGLRSLRAWLAGATACERAGAVVLGAVVLGLGLAALGPATDADSLDYHLGAALEWIRTGAARPESGVLELRLVGAGESLLALGLAGGTDCFGAVMQWTSAVWLALAVAERAGERSWKLVTLLLFLTPPVLGFLVPNQKPQLMPSAAVVAAGLIAAERWGRLEWRDGVLAWSALCFGMSCKYSFVLTGAVAGALLIAAAARRPARSLIPSMGAAVLAFIVLALPVYARNLEFYGDPLSPLLERWKATPDPNVVRFAEYLKVAAGERNLAGLLVFPLRLIIPDRLGNLSTVLGIGSIAGLLAMARSRWRPLLVAALGAAIVVLAAGQLAPRFFLEPYCWAAAAWVLDRESRAPRGALVALAGQGTVSAVIAIAGAWLLAPGAITASLRDQVLSRAAFEYADARWLDEVLPADATLLSDMRSFALMPRPGRTLSAGRVPGYADAAPWVRASLEEGRPTYFSARWPYPEGVVQQILDACGEAQGRHEFRYASRNPWNRGAQYEVRVARLSMETASCRRVLARLGDAGSDATSGSEEASRRARFLEALPGSRP